MEKQSRPRDPDPKNTIDWKEVDLDPVKYELFYNRLIKDLLEVKLILMQLSGSPVTRDCGEVAAAFYTPNGDSVCMAAGLFIHVVTVSRVIKYLIREKYEEDIGFYEGDQFLNSDPHIGGMHAPDHLMVMPIFYKGKIMGWGGCFTHLPEIGATEPGGMSPRAKSRYDEGLIIPATKIIEKGVMKRDIFQWIIKSVREPKVLELETKAKAGCNERNRRRMVEIIEEYGVDFFMTAIHRLIEEGETQARKKIQEFIPGKYRARLYSDNIGGAETLLRVQEVEMETTKQGDVNLTFPVVSAAGAGCNNCALPGLEGLVFATWITQAFYDARWNGGSFRIIKFGAPEGSCLNVDREKAVAACPVGVGMSTMSAMNIVLSSAQYVAGKRHEILGPMPLSDVPLFGGIDQFGRVCANLTIDCNSQGVGARWGKDGVDSGGVIWTPISDAADVETWENTGPILYLSRKHAPDSGGLGKYRGGSGWDALYSVLDVPTFVMLSIGGGAKVSSTVGMWGAYPVCSSTKIVLLDTNLYELAEAQKPLPHSINDLMEKDIIKASIKERTPTMMPAREMKKGDILAIRYLGGGGLGDPIERDPQWVKKDVKNGLTTLRVAKEIYCVAIDPETFELDLKKTEEMRRQKRKERLAQGIPAKEYVKKMVEKRKKRELPKVVLDLFDELLSLSYSEGFKKQLEFEEKFAMAPDRSKEKFLDGDGKEILELTPHVNLLEDKKGKIALVCSHCKYVYCDARENYKLYSLVYDRDPREIRPEYTGPDPDYTIFREFYCPGCGAQMDVEATPPGMTILHNMEIDIDSVKEFRL